MNDFYAKNGYCVVPGVVPAWPILAQAESVYRKQLDYLGIHGELEDCLFRFFEKDRQRYIRTTRTVQNIPELHRAGIHFGLLSVIKEYAGVMSPVVQKPFLHINCKRLAAEKEYYVFPPHQDYRDDQGSLNAVVAYVALVDINKDLGALQVAPGTHLMGLLPTAAKERTVETGHAKNMKLITVDYEPDQWVDVEMKAGDVLLLSSFVLHRSGLNVLDRIRWAALFRYNDLEDEFFLENGYPYPYVQRPENIVDEKYPFAERLRKVFGQ